MRTRMLSVAVLVLFFEFAGAQVSPPAIWETCSGLLETGLPKLSIVSYIGNSEAEAAEANLNNLFLRMAGLGFSLPREIKVRLTKWDEDSSALSVFVSVQNSILVGRHRPLLSHEAAHLILDFTLWNDPKIKMFRDLRKDVSALDKEYKQISKSIRRLSLVEPLDRERLGSLQAEQESVRNWYSLTAPRVFGSSRTYLRAVAELWSDVVAFADTGIPQMTPFGLDYYVEHFGMKSGKIHWLARDFSQVIDVDQWQNRDVYLAPHTFFGPVRSYIGGCLKTASTEERFAYVTALYEIIREILNENYKLYGNRFNEWPSDLVQENKRIISSLNAAIRCPRSLVF